MKKTLLMFIMQVVGLCTISAEEPVTGIIVTYEGNESVYKLDEVPTVKYEDIEGVRYATLYLNGQETPVLNLPVDESKPLIITYGTYLPTGINEVKVGKVTMTERAGRKYFMGGNLVIVDKSGKKYNVKGMEE